MSVREAKTGALLLSDHLQFLTVLIFLPCEDRTGPQFSVFLPLEVSCRRYMPLTCVCPELKPAPLAATLNPVLERAQVLCGLDVF